jgi:hypothetical protein
MYVCMYVCTYVRMYVCMYVCKVFTATNIIKIFSGYQLYQLDTRSHHSPDDGDRDGAWNVG